METAKLKKFAQFARRSLMEQVSAKLKLVLAENSAARRERAEAIKKLEEAIKNHGKDKVIERVAYIWFNRFCALRFMDVNRYTRIGVVSPAEGQFQPEILAEAKMGHIDDEMVYDKVRQQIFALLDGKAPSRDPQGEAYRLLVVAACNFWNKAMRFLFQHIDDYTELLMPDDLLSGNSILAQVCEAIAVAPVGIEQCEVESEYAASHSPLPTSHSSTSLEVEVIGWLYQFYISEKKDEVFDGLKKNKKITPENIPAATQLFTPHWIVKYLVENSLGRLWMLNRPNSRLLDRMDYYIKPVESGECEVGSNGDSSHSPLSASHLRISSPEEIRICDPACGSGHMLTYAFDLLYAIYEEEGYESAEIPEKILTHNLYGIEIDERAGELAAFALTMKARSRSRRFFRHPVKPNVCVLQKVAFEDGELAAVGSEKWVVGSEKQKALHHDLHLFEEADNFGSLLRPQLPFEDIESLQKTVHSTLSTSYSLFDSMTHHKVLQALRQADYLSPKYHVVIANPPYMGGKGMNGRLAAWVKDNYPNSKSDLFAMFIERNLDLAQKHGAVAMITMQSWMFLSSFEALRARLLGQNTLLSMAHLGARAFDSIGGEVVSTTAFVLERLNLPDYKGSYLRLVDGSSEMEKNDAILGAVRNPNCEWLYRASTKDFNKIPGSPIAYWVSDALRNSFLRHQKLGELVAAKSGMSTTNNDRFLRVWFEVSLHQFKADSVSAEDAAKSNKRWFPYIKGGSFRKWYGNLNFVVNWKNDGEEIKHFVVNNPRDPNTTHWSRRIFNSDRFFQELLAWSRISMGALSVRRYDRGMIFSDASNGCFGDSIQLDKATLLLNSKVVNAILEILSPTMNFYSGDIDRIPAVLPKESTALNNMISLSKEDWDTYETSWDFTCLPLLNPDYRQPTLKATYQKLRAHCREMTLELQRLEEENNRIFIDAYGLQDELTPEVPLEEITLTCNPYYRYGKKAVISSVGSKKCEVGRKENSPLPTSHFPLDEEMEARLLQDSMKELVGYAVGCIFGRYSLNIPGLVIANQGEIIADYYKKIEEYRANERKKLSGTYCLAEGHGSGGDDLSSNSTIPEGGAVRSDKSDTQGGGVDSLQYCGGASEAINSGVQKLSVDSTGFQSGSGNPTDDRSATMLSPSAESGANPESIRGDQAHDLFSDSEADLTFHFPLSTSHLSFVPDEDNVIPMLDGDWFTDDIAERFRKFLRVAFGDEHYEANLKFVEKALGKNGKARDIRDYFLKDFYTDHVKRYKKRPIYWLFSSPKGSFNALIYMHRYRPDTVSVVLNDYLREFRTKLTSHKNHLEAVSISAGSSQGEKTKALKEIEKVKKMIAEMEEYEREVLYPLATEQVEIDLDDGVKVNYPKLGAALKKIPGLEAKED